MARKQVGTTPSTDTDAVTKNYVETSTLTNKTPTIEGSVFLNQALTVASATLQFLEASVAKAYVQWRGTASNTAPNTVRFQTVTDTNADIIIGTNANTDIFVAGNQGGLNNRGYVGIGGNESPAVTLDVTGEARVSVAGANAASVVNAGGAQALTNKNLSSATNTFPTSLVTLTGTQTLTNKTLTSPTITTPTIEGSAALNQATTSANATLSLRQASSTKAFLEYRGTTAGTLPNTVRFQTVTASNADIQIGTNANTDIFVAGGQNGLNRGYVGIGNSTPAVTLDVTGEARVSVAANNATSVVTVGGTQTLTAKTLTSPKITSGNAPATATSTGVAGQVEWDSSYVYICTAANTWKRALLETW